VVNASLDARIDASAQRACFADLLAAEGVVTVSIDDEGRLVERRPDGTTTVL
jgi:hypothetical protein